MTLFAILFSVLTTLSNGMFHTSYELCYILMLKEFMDHGGDFNLVQYLYDTALPILPRGDYGRCGGHPHSADR